MFVHQLWGSGMVDETERDALLEPVERNERRLLRQGAMGRSTMVYEVRALGSPQSRSASRADPVPMPPAPGHDTSVEAQPVVLIWVHAKDRWQHAGNNQSGAGAGAGDRYVFAAQELGSCSGAATGLV